MVIYKSFILAATRRARSTIVDRQHSYSKRGFSGNNRLQILLLLTCLLAILSTLDTVQAEDFYTLDHTFVFNGLKDCKDNEYYDPVQFACKRCESSFNLVPSKDSKCIFSFCRLYVTIISFKYDEAIEKPTLRV